MREKTEKFREKQRRERQPLKKRSPGPDCAKRLRVRSDTDWFHEGKWPNPVMEEAFSLPEDQGAAAERRSLERAATPKMDMLEAWNNKVGIP